MSIDHPTSFSWHNSSQKDLFRVLLCAMFESMKNGDMSNTWDAQLSELLKKEFQSESNSSELNSSERQVDDCTLYARISHILSMLGVPPNLLGYEYLRHAIVIVVQNKNSLCGITKTIYPAVAKKYQVSASSVERAMRHAIEVSCSRGDPKVVESFFGNTINPNSGKPTNSEFISKIADMISLDYSAIAFP